MVPFKCFHCSPNCRSFGVSHWLESVPTTFLQSESQRSFPIGSTVGRTWEAICGWLSPTKLSFGPLRIFRKKCAVIFVEPDPEPKSYVACQIASWHPQSKYCRSVRASTIESAPNVSDHDCVFAKKKVDCQQVDYQASGMTWFCFCSHNADWLIASSAKEVQSFWQSLCGNPKTLFIEGMEGPWAKGHGVGARTRKKLLHCITSSGSNDQTFKSISWWEILRNKYTFKVWKHKIFCTLWCAMCSILYQISTPQSCKWNPVKFSIAYPVSYVEGYEQIDLSHISGPIEVKQHI